MIRSRRAAAAALLAAAIGGCTQAAREPPPDPVAIAAGLCAQEIAEFKDTLAGDAQAGRMARDVYRRASSDIVQAEMACQAGRGVQARFIVASAKRTYGYPL